MKIKTPTHLLQAVLTGGAALTSLTTMASSDYGPAIWNPPSCVKYYSSGYGHKFHVIHDMEGYYLSSVSRLRDCSVSASVHYAVNGLQDTSTDAPAGQITQMIADADYAWHVLCWNKYCTGTEHEGFANNPAWYTKAMYQASAGISAHEASKYGYAIDRNHIVGHNEWQNSHWTSYAGSAFGINTGCNTHHDPGSYWDWSYYMSLMNSAPNTKPLVLVGANGIMSAFAIFPDGSIHTTWQTNVGGNWSAWVSLGGSGNTSLDGVVLSDGRMALYACGGGAVYTSWQNTVGGNWTTWTSLGGTGFTRIKALIFSDNHMALVGCGNGTAINYDVQTSPGGSWSGWSSLGGSGFTAVDGVVLGSQLVSIFGCGNGPVYTAWQSSVGGSFSTLTSLGGTGFDQIKALVFNDDHMAIVGCGYGTAVYYQAQSAPGSSWLGWSSLGGSGNSAVSAVVLPNQLVSAFTCGGDSVWTAWQSSVGGSFSTWTSLGGSGFQNMTSVVLPSGAMSVFGGASGSPLWTTWQTSVGGTWSSWKDLGGTLK